MITAAALIASARSLRGDEEGDNPEYDRALVELITDVLAKDPTLIALEIDYHDRRTYVEQAVLTRAEPSGWIS